MQRYFSSHRICWSEEVKRVLYPASRFLTLPPHGRLLFLPHHFFLTPSAFGLSFQASEPVWICCHLLSPLNVWRLYGNDDGIL